MRSAALIWWERFVSGLGNFPQFRVMPMARHSVRLWWLRRLLVPVCGRGPEVLEVAANRFALSGNLDWSTFDHTASSPKSNGQNRWM
jgi:hypothetical protein